MNRGGWRLCSAHKWQLFSLGPWLLLLQVRRHGAGLDNIILFLRGCKELGLKESQLFDPGDLQDTSNRVTVKNIDCSRKLKNVLVTIYWLGKAANSCTSYSGSTLNLKEFEGLLAQMRKETEDIESPKRSIRDSGYIDCWDSERSDSLSPPRHGRDDSFDSLDSFGSRSQQTPSPDVVLRGSSDGRGSDSETDLPHRKMPDVKKDDMLARRTSHGEPKSAVPFNQYLPNKSNQTFYVPAPLRKKKAEREEYRKSWSTATSPLGDRPFRSVSMFDMRSEEEAMAQPHSKARHEKLQNIHNQLKEDETRWQDDLARWKSRRRSASQDLIKKEAERKKMERLLSGEGTNERRKSIKTYREIVEEKERRERELHEAYKNAKTQEEAESILQQYIERFTISEAVLERLQMPKILERSHSVEPNSPLKDPNPLRYLRQQSLPAPKFTATIEATIVPTTDLEPSGSTGRTSPSKSVVSKAVPMLTPKPYSQPKNTQEVLKNFKVDGKVSMNGENFNSVEEKDKECTTVIFTQSPSRSLKFDGVASGDRPPMELKKDPTSVELSLQRPATQSVHREPTTLPGEADLATSQQAEGSPGAAGHGSPAELSPGSEQKQFKSTVVCASPVVKSLEFSPSPVPPEEIAPCEKDVKKPEMEKQKKAALPAMQEVMKPNALEQEGSVVLPFLKKLPETSQVTLHNSDLQADSGNSDKSNRFNFWSWDPEEERKRQERWQHEQERLLQEKYQKEQDKLKEEWEKAQREVEEEERRYYEEERKIIEDTVVPFIVSSNSAELLSSSSSTTEGNKTANASDSNGSPEEGKPEEVTRQKKLLWEQDSMPSLKNKENERWQEKRSSGNKVLSGHPEMGILKGGDQEHQVPVMERCSPARLNLPLTQDVPWNQQLLMKQSPQRAEDTRQRPLLGQSAGQQPSSTGEGRRAGCHENFRSGPSSPCSPAAPSQSPNRSVSGKKLCSTCGLPLGKGAAMIIETLGLYFHIQCFRCGICKGQLGDAASGTDVRIRNGLLNCNDCYIRSRTAGQPTTL
uniref:LIM and calponin homology domains 1 n=1 Tax=Meleagris gallopavo TaxID=9103 RepID=A0A803XL38_MELGA